MTLSDLEHLLVDTPENVVFQYKLAGIGSRFIAAFLDNLLIAVMQILLLYLAFTLDIRSTPVLVAFISLIAFGIVSGYYIFFEGTQNGKSPGKARMRLRVVKQDGTPIGMEEAILRNFLRLIDFLPAYYMLGVLVMFFDPYSRRLGDFVAGTVVIIDQSRKESIEQSIENMHTNIRREHPPNHELDSFVAGLPTENMNANDFELLERYMKRRTQMAHPEPLAARIYKPLRDKLEFTTIPLNITIGHFLETLYFYEYFRRRDSDDQ
jgi:uncharacterized RDD family membrane protein YckC